MSFNRLIIIRLTLLLVLVVPFVAWFLVKPVRVIVPGVMGMSCPDGPVCVDDVAQVKEASQLYTEALGFVSSKLGAPRTPPKIVFCSTQTCADAFGLGARSAVTFGQFGAVIGPRAWKPFYVRHEMIHYLQGERLGVLNLLFKLSWLIEGMAYGLSEDPREPLSDPFEAYRRQFKRWVETIDNASLWDKAAEI